MEWTKVKGGWLDEDENFMSDAEAEIKEQVALDLYENETD